MRLLRQKIRVRQQPQIAPADPPEVGRSADVRVHFRQLRQVVPVLVLAEEALPRQSQGRVRGALTAAGY